MTVPASNKAIGQTGHTTDHNAITTELGVRPTLTEAHAAFARVGQARPAGNTVVIIGDSITAANSNGSLGRIGDQWFQHLCVESRQRLRYAGYYGTAGYTLAQIESTHLPTVLALDPPPAACFIAGGTNDVGPGLAWSFSAATTALDSMVTQLRAAGILPVLVQIPPRGDSVNANTNVMKWNAYIDRLGAQYGYPVLDMHTPLVSPSTGGFKTGYDTGDSIHPSQKGHRAVATYNLSERKFAQIFPLAQPFADRWGGPYNLITTGYGLFTADGNSDGIADGWTATNGGGTTFSLVTPDPADDLLGNWQQISRPNSAASNLYLQRLSITGWSVGDTLQFSCRVQSEQVEATDTAGWSAYTFFTGADAAESYLGTYNWVSEVKDGLVYGEFVVPAATSAVNVTLQVDPITTGGPVVCRFGEVTLRNLTTMGLV